VHVVGIVFASRDRKPPRTYTLCDMHYAFRSLSLYIIMYCVRSRAVKPNPFLFVNPIPGHVQHIQRQQQAARNTAHIVRYTYNNNNNNIIIIIHD